MIGSLLDTIHVATLNVRYDTHSDHPVPIPPNGSIPLGKRSWWSDVYAERPWAERRSRMIDALLSTGPIDIVGFQEVLHNQLLDLQALLPGYDCVGVGRDDGKQKGEYSPVFWDGSQFELVRWKTVWLSPHPDQAGSIGWDASQTRIATIVTLRVKDDIKPRQLMHVVNTHFDDAGQRARAESSLVIREQVKRWVEMVEDPEDISRHGPGPVILIGDFNSPATEDGYKNMTSRSPLPSGARSFQFIDSITHLDTRQAQSLGEQSSTAARQSAAYGPLTTYTGFTRPGKTKTSRIDFLMLALNERDADSLDGSEEAIHLRGRFSVTGYAVIDNWIEEGDVDGWTGRWSDHRAVKITIERAYS